MNARRRRPWSSALAAVMTAFCSAAGVWLALKHPLSPLVTIALFAIATTTFWVWPRAWLVGLPALLPVISLAPWTGWITFEEFDLLVLAAASGGYLRLVAPARQEGARLAGQAVPPLVFLLVPMYAAALRLSL